MAGLWASTKFACCRLTSAEPIRSPLHPASSISRPADLSVCSNGLTNAQPQLRPFSGWLARLCIQTSFVRSVTAEGSSSGKSSVADRTYGLAMFVVR